MTRFCHTRTVVLTAGLIALAPVLGHAQSNAPLTGGMTGGTPAATSATTPGAALPQAQLPQRPVVQQVQTPMPQTAAPAAASPVQPVAQSSAQPAAPAAAQPTQAAASAPAVEENFGDVTRALLAAQADGRRAGGALPILGPVSSAAWDRYLDSFSHPIPDFFKKRVETKNTN